MNDEFQFSMFAWLILIVMLLVGIVAHGFLIGKVLMGFVLFFIICTIFALIGALSGK